MTVVFWNVPAIGPTVGTGDAVMVNIIGADEPPPVFTTTG